MVDLWSNLWSNLTLLVASVTRRKQQRPGIASNDNATNVPTARSSADLVSKCCVTLGSVLLRLCTELLVGNLCTTSAVDNTCATALFANLHSIHKDLAEILLGTLHWLAVATWGLGKL